MVARSTQNSPLDLKLSFIPLIEGCRPFSGWPLQPWQGALQERGAGPGGGGHAGPGPGEHAGPGEQAGPGDHAGPGPGGQAVAGPWRLEACLWPPGCTGRLSDNSLQVGSSSGSSSPPEGP